MAFNLRWMRVFASVVQSGGFSAAARSIHVSQPAVSRTVRLLEEHFGTALLERGPGGIVLTEAGRIMDRHARSILASERAAEAELMALTGLRAGTLRIGASTTIATYMLAPLLDAFSRAHPLVDLRVTSANTFDIVALLKGYELDVALVEGPVLEPDVSVAVWREDELVVIASPDHPLAQRSSLRAADLGDARFLVREPGSGTRAVTESALAESGISLTDTIEMSGTEAIKQASAAGLGLAIVSRAAVSDQVALGRLRVLEVEDLTIRRQLSRLSLTGRVGSAAADAFDRLLSEASDDPHR